jgi:hypothetical protein
VEVSQELLAARLESDGPGLLAQVRSEAFSIRMINVLNAIEYHTAALEARPARRTEASFLASYRFRGTAPGCMSSARSFCSAGGTPAGGFIWSCGPGT